MVFVSDVFSERSVDVTKIPICRLKSRSGLCCRDFAGSEKWIGCSNVMRVLGGCVYTGNLNEKSDIFFLRGAYTLIGDEEPGL